MKTARFGSTDINDSLPNESRRDHGIHAYRIVRGIRTLRAGVAATAKTWTLRTISTVPSRNESQTL
jgi:hypothetical protein